jgi:hypothetical protein
MNSSANLPLKPAADAGRSTAGMRNNEENKAVAQTVSYIQEGAMTTAAQKKKVHKVMHEHKKGTLRSGSGKKVRSRKQAIAIAMSESHQSKKKRS